MKIRFITSHFPKLPPHFDLWAKSCAYNPEIDWLVITSDEQEYEVPNNIQIERMSYDELKKLFKGAFDFPIYVEKVYKTCDFKPIYGHIFRDYLRNYDFWGHCDIRDMIYGNIRKFITNEIFEKYDKIMYLGHMTLYRNTEEVNQRYLIPTKNGMPIRQILNDPYNRAFDEINESSINQIYIENNIPFCRMDECYADIFPNRKDFRLSGFDDDWNPFWIRKRGLIFEWNKGQLYGLALSKGQIEKTEYAYIHFQKRTMPVKIEDVKVCERFLITPEGFIEINEQKEITVETIKKYSRFNPFYPAFFKSKYRALKWHLRHLKESGRW